MSARSITHTVFTPLSVAVELDDLSQDWGISRNKLLNLIIAFGLQNKDKLKEALLEGRGATNSDPSHQPASPTPTPNHSLGTNPKEEVIV